MPRVGENIEIPYFQAKIGCQMFYVDSIHHFLEDKKQKIGIFLRSGSFNQYLHLRKDEAYLKREITDEEFRAPMDYTVKEKLKLRVW